MRCYSLFCGIGGFDLALQRQGHTMVGACEINEDARRIYAKNFGHEPSDMDATTIDPAKLPDFDLLCAGFPCQAFSVAGKRLGFEDTRGTLFYEIARIAKQKRPRYLLLENVAGLLSHDNGRTFAEILATLDEIGYDAEWQVLNSKYFVPQNRERIFIIGYLRGTPRPEIFPIRESDGEVEEEGQIIELGNTCETHTTSQSNKVYSSAGIAPSLIAGTHGYAQGYIEDKPMIMADRSRHKAKLGRNLESPKEIANSLTSVPKDNYLVMLSHTKANIKQRIQDRENVWTLDTNGAKQGIIVHDEPELKQVGNVDTKGHNSMWGRVYDPDGISSTLGAEGGGLGAKTGLYNVEGRIRRLTPLECERLQGFPDNWTQGISDTQRYRCIGNAVTVPLVEFLVSRL